MSDEYAKGGILIVRPFRFVDYVEKSLAHVCAADMDGGVTPVPKGQVLRKF
jgi:hypothetical protein